MYSPHHPKLLNVGCGGRFHSAWRNVDLVSHDPAVLQHDLRNGIPFDDLVFDGVYHSHVLEHLEPEEARILIAECYRVLKMGGVLRVVVPDLEGIARAYLDALQRANRGLPGSAYDHQWMQLELLDQLVRTTSGGEMGMWMSRSEIPNRQFVEQRMGSEMLNCVCVDDGASAGVGAVARKGKSIMSKVIREIKRVWRRTGLAIGKWVVDRMHGPDAESLIAEARFRRGGEIHRWMYDRVSLANLLRDCGFQDIRVTSATDSRIDNFHEFQLDAVGNEIRKPDSLFMEAIKPAAAQVKAA